MVYGTIGPYRYMDPDLRVFLQHASFTDDRDELVLKGEDLTAICGVGPIKGPRAIPRRHRKAAPFPRPQSNKQSLCLAFDREGAEAIIALIEDPRRRQHVLLWYKQHVFPDMEMARPTSGPLASTRPVVAEDLSPCPPSHGQSGSGKFVSPFDKIKRVDGEGEYWLAREAAPAFGYLRYEQVPGVLSEAMQACRNNGLDPADHFRPTSKVIEGGRWGTTSVDDVRMTRYGCYLFALSADGRKPEVAAAKHYFAVNARENEVRKEQGLVGGDMASMAEIVKGIVGPMVQGMMQTLDRRLAAFEGAKSLPRPFEILTYVPPGYFRFSEWRELRDIPLASMDQRYEIRTCKRLSYEFPRHVHRIKPEGDPRPDAWYFHQDVLKRWEKIFRQKNPVWTTKSLPFQKPNKA